MMLIKKPLSASASASCMLFLSTCCRLVQAQQETQTQTQRSSSIVRRQFDFDSQMLDEISASDPSKPQVPLEIDPLDPLHQSDWPSNMPSMSSIPSSYPSNDPTVTPSVSPSKPKSTRPSSSPSLSQEPTSSHKPTQETLEPSEIPSDFPSLFPSQVPTTMERPDNYFNYNPASPYGPPHWDDVRDGDEFFDRYVSASSRECGDSQNSPINLEYKDSCEDDHQVNSHGGSNDFDTNTFEILPHALRIIFEKSGNPPGADFSNLSKFVDAFYLDVKIPSEHTMEGKQYLGEVHIGHDWSSRGINVGFFLDPIPDIHNSKLEMLIREWEEESWKRKHECKHRSDIHYPPYERKYPIRSKTEMERVWNWQTKDRSSSGSADWDVYQLQPTVWYYGYRGGYTVPPCTENVYWRFLDYPAHMSWSQYNRMKALIVDVLDEDCRQSAVAHNGNINRPVQRFRGDVWRCKGWKIRYRDDWCNMWPDNYHGVMTGKLKSTCKDTDKDEDEDEDEDEED